MNLKCLPILLAAGVLSLASCSSTSELSGGSATGGGVRKSASLASGGARLRSVRTTAYTHTEADHIQYGKKSALGTTLRFDQVRSAAADWSVYPVGTLFRVDGEQAIYQIDDYGSALVGTNTIDLYKPNKSTMNQWGVKHKDIQIVRWGSYEKSAEILEPRQRHNHVKRMLDRIRLNQRS
jgi:3D (Asp-Asp-Asp) domain-containing protein